jgi:hypothetical protein
VRWAWGRVDTSASRTPASRDDLCTNSRHRQPEPPPATVADAKSVYHRKPTPTATFAKPHAKAAPQSPNHTSIDTHA